MSASNHTRIRAFCQSRMENTTMGWNKERERRVKRELRRVRAGREGKKMTKRG